MRNIRVDISQLVSKLREIELAGMSINERISKLVDLKIHALPILYENLTAEEYMAIVSELASADASSALSMSMHLYTLWGLSRRHGEQFASTLDEVATHGRLLGSLNEPGLYFLALGQLTTESYPVKAKRVDGGYRVSGLKKFVSLEPFVSFLPVYCMVENYSGNDVGVISLMLSKDADGVSVISDWNSLAMQDSHSNTVKFDSVFCPDEFAICGEDTPISSLSIQGYLFRFNVCCVYIGLARKALNLALDTAKSKRPPNGLHALARYPGIQFSVAEMIISMGVMEAQMKSLCSDLNEFLSHGGDVDLHINGASLIAKEVISRESEALVSNAMKITGISSLSNENALSTIFKDIKASQFHPPQRDVTYEILAKQALGVISYKQRWM